MSGQNESCYHSFLIEGLAMEELLNFARSTKMDLVANGAIRCDFSTYEIDGVDKVEAKNVFDSFEKRDRFVAKLAQPDHAALSDMGIKISSLIGITMSSYPGNSAAVPPPQGQISPPLTTHTQSSNIPKPGKSRWPELKNVASKDAVEIITTERPDVKPALVKQGAMVTMDMRLDRVRIVYDETTGLVTSIPKIG